ncbi:MULTISPECIES: hypothetical protein [Flavobacterium]|uniref:Lipoprotein n=1 Tax=Flavobacterium suzhouense TaxID=1529638 RepID=A0ABW5NVX1_9FLAO|nr:hypothetical protein [Flavobacterium sp. AG291]RDI06920.1 hypothetical protein DEU42_11318 [Flavobacterium sp. AG291]
MKKMIALSAAVVLTLASCGKKEDANADAAAADTTAVVVEETVVDTVATPEAASATEVEAATSTEVAH